MIETIRFVFEPIRARVGLRSAVMFFLLTFVVSGIASAQIQTPSEESRGGVEAEQDVSLEDLASTPPAGAVSCFDYYQFGSVEANLVSSTANTVPGATITFSGALHNKNPYPIVSGDLYIKVFRIRTSGKDVNGPDVVDQFFATSDLYIPAGGEAPVRFSWRVPSHAQGGEYKIAAFVTSARKFNLLGLPFTDDVIGNTVSFGVTTQNNTGVIFEKSSVEINNEPYQFAAFPPFTSAADPVTLTAQVKNTTGKEQAATISWVVYKWDAHLRENAVVEEAHSVAIPAGASIEDTLTITDNAHPVYFAVATLSWKDTKSILGIRFVRPGVNQTRINFPSIVFFPLVKGQKNTVFSCLHNVGTEEMVSGNTLELTLTDMGGNLIHQYVYDGDVTDAMMGVADTFIPKQTYNAFQLQARLYKNGQFIDEATLTYDCEDIDPSTCRAVTSAENTMDLFGLGGDTKTWIGGGIGILILAFILSIFLMTRSSKKQEMHEHEAQQEILTYSNDQNTAQNI